MAGGANPTDMPMYAEEEASGRPAKSNAASAMVESFVFIFRCSMT
jgi:hypothetical protein